MTTASELAALRATLEAKMAADERDRKEAKEQRENMAKDIGEIMSNASAIDNRVSNIEKDMQNVKPIVARVNSWQSMAMGAAIVLGLVGTAVTMFWEMIKQKFTEFFAGL